MSKTTKIINFKTVSFGLFFLFIFSCKNETSTVEKSDPNFILDLKETSKDSISSKNLISISEVKKLLDNKENIAIIEVSKKDKYKKGHISTALNIWRPDYENKVDFPFGGMRGSKEQIEKLLSKMGIDNTQKIIIYDTKGSCDAIRFAWILKTYGYDDFLVMNGGKVAWQKANFPVDTLIYESNKKVNFQFPNEENKSILADFEEVQKATLDTNYILIDTREPEEFKGEPYIYKGKFYPYKKGAFTYGCIPSSVHLNWSDLLDLEDDHRIKSIKDLKYNLKKVGVSPNKKIITYCQSGVRSSNTAFILSEILNYPDIKNYDGSWIEWSYNFVEKENVEIERHTSEEKYRKLATELKNTK